jgi:hypothetical protein
MDAYTKERSNYVSITDIEAFKSLISKLGGIAIEKEGKFGFVAEEGLASDIEDENEDLVGIDAFKEISKFLKDGEVMVVQSIGGEGIRYLSGLAYAFNNEYEFVNIDLNEIYKKAVDKFGVKDITVAEY